MIEGLGSIRLEVSNLERAVAFYRDGLRFGTLVMDAGAAARATLMAGDVQLVLALDGQASGPARRRGAGVSLTVNVAGVDAYHDALVARGLSPSAPVDDADGRHFSVVDPDGYRWCFRQGLD